jgi:hypothetical protein
MKPYSVDSPKVMLVGFLYELMRDHVPLSVVEGIVKRDEATKKESEEVGRYSIKFTNGYLALYAEELAERLVKEEDVETKHTRYTTFTAHVFIGVANRPLCLYDHHLEDGSGNVVSKCGRVGWCTDTDFRRTVPPTCPGCLKAIAEEIYEARKNQLKVDDEARQTQLKMDLQWDAAKAVEAERDEAQRKVEKLRNEYKDQTEFINRLMVATRPDNEAGFCPACEHLQEYGNDFKCQRCAIVDEIWAQRKKETPDLEGSV